MSTPVRYYTNKLDEMMDEGIISPRSVADMALCAMSESEVHSMMRVNDLLSLLDNYEDDDDAEDYSDSGC